MKQKPRPKIAHREIKDGRLYAYDKDGRPCLDVETRERIVLIHDLRVYGDGLHKGALGWTIPETTDGYTFSDVNFDTGRKLRLRQFTFERVSVDSEEFVAAEIIASLRNTKFDADPIVAATCRQAWISKCYGEYLSLTDTTVSGIGDQELYAFTFPSLIELAAAKGEEHYPVKVGFSMNTSDGAYGRIRQQIFEKAGFPEKPVVLLVFRTWDGRHLETQIHRKLRAAGRKIPNSLGREWFRTSAAEVCQIINECELAEVQTDRVIVGDDDTVEELLYKIETDEATIEWRRTSG